MRRTVGPGSHRAGFARIGHARRPPADREDMDTFTAPDRASLRTRLFELFARDEDEGLPPFWD